MSKAPTWFLIIGIIALIWNIIGAAAVIVNFMVTPEQIAALPIEQQQMYSDTPVWGSYASLLAVLAGALACIGLLVKKAWAYPLFIVSFLALVIQDIAIFIIVDAVSVLGVGVLVMQSIVALIAIALIYLAFKAKNKNWIA